MREHLTPEKEDELGFATPSKPSELRSLPDDEFNRLWRKFMFANQWGFDKQAEYEMTSRLIASLKDFKDASRRASNWLIRFTVVLVVLTAVLIWLTIRLE